MAGSKTAPDQATVRADVRTRFAGQPIGEMDIEALVMMVMMEVAAAEEQAIRETLAEMKKVDAEKERLHVREAEARKQQGAVKDDLKALKAKSDSLNELSQMNSMRLQMLMDRRAKFIETLSNLLKKLSDTQHTLVQNLK